ncbi:MAG: sel1 repeat family protein [Saprospiraceae bacterium]|nr:sel1 repeat family protein [Saprospiraceae bacterium]
MGAGINYEKAVEWYTMSAKQGYLEAQNNLGLMYQQGLGVKQDYNIAFKWFIKAAEGASNSTI